MYITRVEIENIKSIKHLVWEIDADKAAGWHVILGDNGTGKSTFLRSIALSAIDASGGAALRVDVRSFLAFGEKSGKVNTQILNDLDYHDNERTLKDKNWIPRRAGLELKLNGDQISVEMPGAPRTYLDGHGWFFASFGSFRRFTGGDEESKSLQKINSEVARHASLFYDGVALTEGMQWLRGLQFQKLEKNESSATLIDSIIDFLNQPGLLPNKVGISEVNSTGINCMDANQASVNIIDLGDGYRSILSMAFELLRQLSLTYGPKLFAKLTDGSMIVDVPGVVQIDEVDAHLHPTWQKQIGFWLTKHFPKIQFIVTTHSPFICQAAENGTIFRLPTPGSQEPGQMLSGSDFNQLVYGNVLDAYSTQAFGYGITRSQSSLDKLNRLADLNMKEAMNGLSSEEIVERETLREMLPTTASILQRV